MASLDDVIGQMRAYGMPELPAGHPRLEGRIVRYGPKKRAWYRLDEVTLKSGRRVIVGAFGLWGGAGEPGSVKVEWTGFSDEEKAEFRRQREAAEKAEREKREARAQAAAKRAGSQWRMAKAPDGPQASAYLERKGVAPEGVRIDADGHLLVPMLRYDEQPPRLVGLQKIAPDGTKRFNKGAAIEGSAARLGSAKNGAPLVVCEGLATGLTIRQALKRKTAVFVAYHCGNLVPAARILRDAFPKSFILFAADDDWKTDGNPGCKHATAAAEAIGNAAVVAPVFTGERADKATDFNDLHQAEGLERAAEQLAAALEKAAPAPPAAGKGGGKKKPRVDDDPRAGFLQERFTYIYPTSTAWDAKIEEIVPIAAMRNMFGKGLVDWWLEKCVDRRTVLAKDVDFMPGAPVTDEGTVNLFRGSRSKPSKAGSCERLLELLLYLCNGEREVYDWVLRWAAYPVQHLGAKMRTAVVMHGPEGTGKNLFWGAVAKAYEPYSSLVTQFQVQSQFNDWISRKLFVVANEVVTRMELKHLKGYVKNLITEERVPIETKNMPVRMEANHMQIVFLSNELLPLHISPGDRRFMVIKTPPELGADYYAEVGAELAAGGAERLHWHLLHEVEIGEFNEHTKPMMTEAKRDLIELGLSSAQLFWRELHDGLLPLPYAPALSEDLYRAYTAWCQRNGERNPAKINTFSAEFRAMNGVTRKVCRVAVGHEQDFRQRTCFLMQSPEAEDYARQPNEDDDRWAGRTVSVFREQLGEFLKGGGS